MIRGPFADNIHYRGTLSNHGEIGYMRKSDPLNQDFDRMQADLANLHHLFQDNGSAAKSGYSNNNNQGSNTQYKSMMNVLQNRLPGYHKMIELAIELSKTKQVTIVYADIRSIGRDVSFFNMLTKYLLQEYYIEVIIGE